MHGAKLAKHCQAIVDKAEIKIEQWVVPEFSTEAILTVVNSATAKEFRLAWQPLVNFNRALGSFKETVCTEKFHYITIDPTEQENAMQESYCVCRTMMCDLIAVRSLARPEPANENRKQLVVAARDLIKQLGGEPTACINMRMNVIAPKSDPLGATIEDAV